MLNRESCKAVREMIESLLEHPLNTFQETCNEKSYICYDCERQAVDFGKVQEKGNQLKLELKQKLSQLTVIRARKRPVSNVPLFQQTRPKFPRLYSVQHISDTTSLTPMGTDDSS